MEDWLTLSEALDLLEKHSIKIHEATLRRRIYDGEVQAKRFGRFLQIPKSSLLRYINTDPKRTVRRSQRGSK